MPPAEPTADAPVMTLADLRGQPGPVASLSAALEHDRLAHAYLLVGPSGVGKEKAALAVAAARNCLTDPGTGCGGRCGVCQRIWTESHPDVRVIRPRDEGNRNLQVEYVREEIIPFTQFAPFEAASATIIFPDADVSFPAQHAEAANALLKTIEEPRAKVSFVLLSSRPERLLTTIRSRCQRVRFGPLSRQLLIEILGAHGVPEAARGTAAALALGRADRALDLAEEGRAETLLDRALHLDTVAAEQRPGPLLEAAEQLARSEDRDVVLDTLGLLYRDMAASDLGADDTLIFAHRADELRERARGLPAKEAARRFGRIQEAFEALRRNGNAEIVLDALLFGL